MEFHERDEELDLLQDALAAAEGGRGSLVFISGPGGIGKSRLVQHFLATGADGVDAESAVALPHSTDRPFGPIVDLARRRFPRVAEAIDGGAHPDRVFSELFTALNRQDAPRLVWIHDLQFADQATIDLLSLLGQRMRRTSTLLIATYRSDNLEPGNPARTLAANLAATGDVVEIELGPLSADAVRSLCLDSRLDPDLAMAASGGNPFFLRELLQSQDRIPATVRDLIDARLARLTPVGRRALDVLALMGGSADRTLIVTIDPVLADGLGDASEVGMLVADGEVLRFRDDLSREFILTSMSDGQRQALHRHLLEELSRDGRPSVSPSHLAWHADGAGDGVALERYARAAIAEAERAGSWREATQQYSRLLPILADSPPEDRLAMLRSATVAALRASQPALAEAWIREGIGICHDLGDQQTLGVMMWTLSDTLYELGDIIGTRKAANEAVRILTDLDHPDGKAMAAAVGALGALRNAEYRQTVEYARESLALATDPVDSGPAIHARISLGSALMFLGDPEGETILRDAGERAHRKGLYTQAYRALHNSAWYWVEYLDLERARAITSFNEELFRGTDFRHGEHNLRLIQAAILSHGGEWAEARERLQGLLDDPAISTWNRALATLHLAHLDLRSGAGTHHLEEAIALAKALRLRWYTYALGGILTEQAWLRGNSRDAAELLAEADEGLRNHPYPQIGGLHAWWAWRATGKLPGSLDDIPQPFRDEMDGNWRSAAAAWDARGIPYFAALARLAGDDPAEMRRALADLTRLGAQPAIEAHRTRLGRYGIRSRNRGPNIATRTNPAHLTRREADVLRQLKPGARNIDIANALGISEKTVERHLTALYGKLGVTDRASALAEAAHLNLVDGSSPD